MFLPQCPAPLEAVNCPLSFKGSDDKTSWHRSDLRNRPLTHRASCRTLFVSSQFLSFTLHIKIFTSVVLQSWWNITALSYPVQFIVPVSLFFLYAIVYSKISAHLIPCLPPIVLQETGSWILNMNNWQFFTMTGTQAKTNRGNSEVLRVQDMATVFI